MLTRPSACSLDEANARARNTMIAHLGIQLLEAGDGYLKARMPVDHRTRTPAGVLHGGASVAFADARHLGGVLQRRLIQTLLRRPGN